jgi:hypothetical protein
MGSHQDHGLSALERKPSKLSPPEDPQIEDPTLQKTRRPHVGMGGHADVTERRLEVSGIYPRGKPRKE